MKEKGLGLSEKDDSDVEDDFADESDANKDGEGPDNEEPEDEDDGSETVNDFQGKAFDTGRRVPRKAVAKKTPAPVATQKVRSEEECSKCPHGLQRADIIPNISSGGYPHHSPVINCR